MKQRQSLLKNILLTVPILLVSFIAVILINNVHNVQALAPMIFILAVFLISLITQGYVWGIIASLVSVLAVNYAFAFPYFEFNFLIPENFFSAIVMLIVAVTTSTLTTKIKHQERMRLEGEKEKVRANLLRAISHDLRTPLTSIYGSSSTIIENYDLLKSDQQLKLLKEIREDAEWLIRMVENLLSVTRIDGGNVSVIKTPTVLEELVDAVLVKFKKRYPNQPISVEIPDAFISIPMDAMLIEQVLMNLLENAVFHGKGMKMLSLRVVAQDNMAIFQVADDGCGMSKEKVASLFSEHGEVSERPADGNKHNMGIGLSVCETIIRAHGGRIWAESEEGHGSTFCFALEMEVEHDGQ